MAVIARSVLDSRKADAEAPAGVFCLCRDPALVEQVQNCLADRVDGLTIVADFRGSDLAASAPHGVVVVESSLPQAEFQELCQALAQTSPWATVLVAGAEGPHYRTVEPGPIVRFLSDPYVPGLLEQMVEDYLEQYRLRRVEMDLSSQLDLVQRQLEQLSRNVSEEGFQNTASLLRLYHVVSGFSGLTTPREIAELLVSTAASMLKSRRVSLLMPDANREYLSVAAAIGLDPDRMERIRIPIGPAVSGQVFASSRSLLVQDKKVPDGWQGRSDAELIPECPFISMVLVGPDCPVAVLNISDPAANSAYSEESLTGLHTLAEIAAIALANQIRGQERNEARDGIMMAMAKLAESRDPETGTHLERVQNYCRLLAEGLAQAAKYRDVITPEFISTLVWSSPLHDIGKVGVPDHILLKPGRLTPEEFEIMKRHPIIGGDTIRALTEQGRRQDFLQMAMDIAYYHHEKYDGSGYPYGLAGEAIPLSARILALADVYDALTSVRVYKGALPHAQAVEMVRNDSGSHLDPEVVHVFLEREAEFAKLAAELADTIGEIAPS